MICTSLVFNYIPLYLVMLVLIFLPLTWICLNSLDVIIVCCFKLSFLYVVTYLVVAHKISHCFAFNPAKGRKAVFSSFCGGYNLLVQNFKSSDKLHHCSLLLCLFAYISQVMRASVLIKI